MESQLFEHQARDDLRFACLLHRGLYRPRIFPADQQGNALNLDSVQVVLNLAQPLVLVFVLALGFIKEQDHRAIAIAGTSLSNRC